MTGKVVDDDCLLSESPQGVGVVLTDPLRRVVSLGGGLPYERPKHSLYHAPELVVWKKSMAFKAEHLSPAPSSSAFQGQGRCPCPRCP